MFELKSSSEFVIGAAGRVMSESCATRLQYQSSDKDPCMTKRNHANWRKSERKSYCNPSSFPAKEQCEVSD